VEELPELERRRSLRVGMDGEVLSLVEELEVVESLLVAGSDPTGIAHGARTLGPLAPPFIHTLWCS
jgi:hypothetical protein